jgi:transglutaminase-like putative cysteine protease
VKLLRPLPRVVSRVLSVAIVLAWILEMGILLKRSYVDSSPVALAAELGNYQASAQWRGVYYRGEKIGFTVGQTVPTPDGYELQEDGRLQMSLLGTTTAARIKTVAKVDKAFALRSFSFSLDPGSGPVSIEGAIEKTRLDLTIRTPSGTRKETRELGEPPMLSLNLSRKLAAEGLVSGKHVEVSVFDPATLRNAPMSLDVGRREIVRAGTLPVPAFRVESRFSGITSTSWVTDTGEVVREESPTGLMVVKESRERATAFAVPEDVQQDMLQAAAVVPSRRIDEPTAVLTLKVRLDGSELSGPELQGAGQRVSGNVFEVRSLLDARPGAFDPEARAFLAPEAFIESDAPEIVAETNKALAGLTTPRARAEKLVRYVNALIEKKPTISLPSALEVLRTKVGDCNEHAALYVAMARAAGIPSRLAVGLVYLHGAFYYHAWAEVFVEGPPGRGLWLPVDPTLNEFPADATHIRVARGGLDRQTVILGLLGRLKMTVLDLEVRPGSTPILVGSADTLPLDLPTLPQRGTSRTCWSRP